MPGAFIVGRNNKALVVVLTITARVWIWGRGLGLTPGPRMSRPSTCRVGFLHGMYVYPHARHQPRLVVVHAWDTGHNIYKHLFYETLFAHICIYD